MPLGLMYVYNSNTCSYITGEYLGFKMGDSNNQAPNMRRRRSREKFGMWNEIPPHPTKGLGASWLPSLYGSRCLQQNTGKASDPRHLSHFFFKFRWIKTFSAGIRISQIYAENRKNRLI